VLKKVDPGLAHRLFYPGVAAVLAARSGNTVGAMPVISYCSLSERPPLFGVSCSRSSQTLKVVAKSKAFSVCLLGEDRAKSVSLLASRKGSAGADKLATAGLGHEKGKALGTPLILGAVAALECSLLRSLRLGDHVFLVGKIESALAEGDFRNYWRFKSYRPLLYAGWQGGMRLYQEPSRRTRRLQNRTS
jgi:flavin reductase (DIM6/NTAB) family NADH-FMN oxidoreductase RutF